MTRVPARDFLDGTALLLIDGNNLLHRVAGSTEVGALRLLLARLQAAIPPSLETLFVLDGSPDPRAPRHQLVRRGLEIRHSGASDADTLLVEIVSGRPWEERAWAVVVTDDRGLTERVRRTGGRTARLHELEALLARSRQPSAAQRAGTSPPRTVGIGAPARHRWAPGVRSTAGDDAGDGDARVPWGPGRGATKKKGNPSRGRKDPLR